MTDINLDEIQNLLNYCDEILPNSDTKKQTETPKKFEPAEKLA